LADAPFLPAAFQSSFLGAALPIEKEEKFMLMTLQRE
jgi:hypothetical protein